MLDFVGIGVSRCGTTWIAKCLADHPEIFVPPEKELKYYNNPEKMERSDIASFFADAGEGQLLGEYTPRYIIYRDALERIAADNGEVKVIVSLRDPVERAFSQFKYFRYNLQKEEIDDFETALRGPYEEDYVVKSNYADHLANAFEVFGREKVHLLFKSEIDRHPASAIEGLYSFLGVSESFRPDSLEARINRSGPDVGGVLRTDLSGDDDVMVRGERIGVLDSARAKGRAAADALRIRRFLEPVLSPALDTVQWAIEKRAARISDTRSTDGAQSSKPELDEATRGRVYEEYFATQVEGLEDMTDEDLSHWKP